MRQGTLIGPIIIAIGLIAAAVIFAVVGAVLQTADGGTELRLDRAEGRLEELTAEVKDLRQALDTAEKAIERQEEAGALLAAQVPAASSGGSTGAAGQGFDFDLTQAIPEIEDHVATEEMTEVMKLAKTRFNKGITQPRNSTMLQLLGQPRGSYGTTCQGITNPSLKALVETRQVGPIRVTLLQPALDSLERIFNTLQATEPDIYAALGTAGGLCVRLIRGSSSSISNHSFGTAIDIKLQGKLDGFGDGGTQFGLLLLAELFNAEGWYWGATYRREDSMHFEVGEETLQRWRAEGQL
ncbi:M15 family metallopeptidase [uncultured Ruegeria sp.]|uniref:M15 family metallopeptidase n=1 Tax=uncultured Ruegeria sp. TaxID=259304 RepID=UPI00262D1F6D|nr:M15 family metallopeptidase [uncultured Ruegeria sp.]